jgi:hypothetical protein
MQIGDRVQVVGTCRDIVNDNVLVVMDEDSREYWFLSKHVTVVEAAPAAAPTNVDVPYVSGLGEVGQLLNCTMGNWTGEPTSYAYQWKSDGTRDLGTENVYAVQESDVGHSITCVVTASNALGSTTAPPSNAVTVA